jgi:hypothetical protein
LEAEQHFLCDFLSFSFFVSVNSVEDRAKIRTAGVTGGNKHFYCYSLLSLIDRKIERERREREREKKNISTEHSHLYF